MTAAVPLSVSRRTKNHLAYIVNNLLTPFPVTQAMEAMNKAKAEAMAEAAVPVRFSFYAFRKHSHRMRAYAI